MKGKIFELTNTLSRLYEYPLPNTNTFLSAYITSISDNRCCLSFSDNLIFTLFLKPFAILRELISVFIIPLFTELSTIFSGVFIVAEIGGAVSFEGTKLVCSLLFVYGRADVLTAKEQVRHKDIRTTMSIYTHLDAKYKVKSMNKLDEFLDDACHNSM